MTTSTPTDIRAAIRAAATPTDRREIMRTARDAGMLHLIPEPWRVAAINAYLDSPTTVLAAGAIEHADEFGDYGTDARKEMARKGQAMPGGRFPIKNEPDLKRAIHAYGRAKESDKAKVRRHIMKRARGLGRADLIPDSWKSQAASLEQVLSKRVRDFNVTHDRQLSAPLLRTVYLRGVTAHSTVAATTTLLPHQLGIARVNSFLRLAAGDPSAATTDADLLPST